MIDLGKIPEEQKTPLVMELLHSVQQMAEQIEQLREEVARLKEHKSKPKIPPSQLEKDPKEKQKKKARKKRPGSAKRSKTKQLTIHETISVPPKEIPPGSTRAGYNDWIVQGLRIELHNVCYRLECWITPDGKLIKGELPDSVDGHFDAMLRSFILQQYNHGHVTQPLIREELVDFGVDISKGQVSRILTEQKEDFHIEKEGVLCAGLEVSGYINVDDTGARHAGKNGYCTHIGNDLFAWFESTASKSRINFLALLATDSDQHFETEEDWKKHLNQLAVTKDRHVRIATEAALLGSVLHHGFSKELVILSDDAGQFNILLHALCWIHAERTIHKLVPCSEVLNAALSRVANNKEELLVVLDRPDIPLHNNLSEGDIREYVKKRKISGSTRSDAGRRCRDTFTSLKKTCRKLGLSFWDYLYDRVSKAGKITPLPDLIRVRARST